MKKKLIVIILIFFIFAILNAKPQIFEQKFSDKKIGINLEVVDAIIKNSDSNNIKVEFDDEVSSVNLKEGTLFAINRIISTGKNAKKNPKIIISIPKGISTKIWADASGVDFNNFSNLESLNLNYSGVYGSVKFMNGATVKPIASSIKLKLLNDEYFLKLEGSAVINGKFISQKGSEKTIVTIISDNSSSLDIQ